MRDDFSNIIPLYEICIRCIGEFPRDKKRQKSTKLNNLKQKKTNKTKTKQNLNVQIEESNRLRHMHYEGQLQICIKLIHMGTGWNRFIQCTITVPDKVIKYWSGHKMIRLQLQVTSRVNIREILCSLTLWVYATYTSG